jgi:hypothetical protein
MFGYVSLIGVLKMHPDEVDIDIPLVRRLEGGKLVIDSKLTARLRDSFFLESKIPQYADNLKTLRGFKFDCRATMRSGTTCTRTMRSRTS